MAGIGPGTNASAHIVEKILDSWSQAPAFYERQKVDTCRATRALSCWFDFAQPSAYRHSVA